MAKPTDGRGIILGIKDTDERWWRNINHPISAIIQIAVCPVPPSEIKYTQEMNEIMAQLVKRDFNRN